jgi:hypothetical protein
MAAICLDEMKNKVGSKYKKSMPAPVMNLGHLVIAVLNLIFKYPAHCDA